MESPTIRNVHVGEELVSSLRLGITQGSGRHEVGPSTIDLPGEPQSVANVGGREVAAVLLLLQAGIGLVSAFGEIVFGAATRALPAMAGAILVALAVPMLAILLAGGLVQARGWARIGTRLFEIGVLAGMLLRLAIGKGFAFGLIQVMTGLVLPIAVIVASHTRREKSS